MSIRERIMMKTLSLLFVLVLINGCTPILDSTTKKPLQTDPSSRSFGTYIDDKRLQTIVRVNINKADPIFRQARIRVISFKGLVLLIGQVPTEELRLLAGETANRVEAVRQVYNEIHSRANISFLRSSNDTWITSKAKTSLLANKDVNGLKIKVITENGVVYLMGVITEEKANIAANLISNIRGVREVVRVFEYI